MANYRKMKRSVITKCTTRSASKELFLLCMLFYFKLDSVILEEPEYNNSRTIQNNQCSITKVAL